MPFLEREDEEHTSFIRRAEEFNAGYQCSGLRISPTRLTVVGGLCVDCDALEDRMVSGMVEYAVAPVVVHARLLFGL
jgi:hypothetical protein